MADWDRLARPFDPAEALSQQLGLPLAVSRHVVGAIVATSPEAEDLLDAMPATIRALAVSTAVAPVRLYAELRGPVQWSETLAARAASAGDPAVFVCAPPEKAYDTVENRVLVAALVTVWRSAHAVDSAPGHVAGDVVIRRARVNGNRAARFLEHRTLASVPRVRPDGRALRRTRSGKRRRTYVPALALLARAADPVTTEHVAALANR